MGTRFYHGRLLPSQWKMVETTEAIRATDGKLELQMSFKKILPIQQQLSKSSLAVPLEMKASSKWLTT